MYSHTGDSAGGAVTPDTPSFALNAAARADQSLAGTI
jgi:hypothetical protein